MNLSRSVIMDLLQFLQSLYNYLFLLVNEKKVITVYGVFPSLYMYIGQLLIEIQIHYVWGCLAHLQLLSKLSIIIAAVVIFFEAYSLLYFISVCVLLANYCCHGNNLLSIAQTQLLHYLSKMPSTLSSVPSKPLYFNEKKRLTYITD